MYRSRYKDIMSRINTQHMHGDTGPCDMTPTRY